MADFPFALVGFDLDGTLLDTSGELTASLNHALALEGRPPLARDAVTPMVGLGARHMLEVGLERSGGGGPELAQKLLPELLAHYEANLGAGSNPYPGLLDAMATLDAMGVAMAIVTNKYERLAVRLLEAIGMLDRFGCVIGGDTMGPGRGKPKPDPIEEMLRRCGLAPGPARAVFIGDSIYDVQAAHAAGLPAVAVSFGFLHQPVDQLGADAVIDHYDELLPVLAQLGRLLA